MQIIESNIIIEAPKELVWEVLLDFERYDQWNPFTPKVDCDLITGNAVNLHVDMKQDGEIRIQKEQLLWVKENVSIAWGIPSAFPVKTERAQILETLSPNQTRYYTYDKFWGVLVPLIMWLYREDIQRGFDAVAKGLKHQCESIYLNQSGQ